MTKFQSSIGSISPFNFDGQPPGVLITCLCFTYLLLYLDCKYIKIDNKLTDMKGLCKKVQRKMRPLESTMPYMSLERKKLLMNSFFSALFNYCILIWMLHSRNSNTFPSTCLKWQSSFEELLSKDGTVTIDHWNKKWMISRNYWKHFYTKNK